MKLSLPLALITCWIGLSAPVRAEQTQSRHVVVVVWDGMRPDFVSEKETPALWKLRREGVAFLHHHSVYPTATQVNGAAIATGAYPDRSGLLANREYRPAIQTGKIVDTANAEAVRKGDEVSRGKYLALPTIAETVRAAGLRVAVAGSKSVAVLQDRKAEWNTALKRDLLTAFAAAPMSPALRAEAEHLLGPVRNRPEDTNPQRNVFTTRALTEILWREGVPAFTLLWLSDPDLSQHETAPGSKLARAGIKSSDENLAALLSALEAKKARAFTDVLVVSDHGFSTIERGFDIPALLRAAGFNAVTRFKETPQSGQIMVVGNGGSVLFYVIGNDRSVTQHLVEWLQHSPFAGVLFTREKFEGTFDLATAHLRTPEPPDVVLALRWNMESNRFGVPGQIMAVDRHAAGRGTHGTLSPRDVHNVFIAAGPHFRRDATSRMPSGNIDLAPTVLSLLQLPAPNHFDGRILSEAMMDGTEDLSLVRRETLEATRAFGEKRWRQYLKISRVGETVYFDEGNGALGTSKEK